MAFAVPGSAAHGIMSPHRAMSRLASAMSFCNHCQLPEYALKRGYQLISLERFSVHLLSKRSVVFLSYCGDNGDWQI